ncbi:hypothetical protein PR048_020169 [Dryococelus australis]|uniref:Secreted protein n=1 Tax=Dryococelus australis TaxID=614101 RepID=A0ABQ9H5S1_9NEOP|nr:hypothetical protein PR048_020169 [Dryococelus australis]
MQKEGGMKTERMLCYTMAFLLLCPVHEFGTHLYNVLSRRWIICTSIEDQHLVLWPPRSQVLAPCDIYLWACIKDMAHRWRFMYRRPKRSDHRSDSHY